MFSYKYPVDCCNYGTKFAKIEFYKGWKRFHSCNAAVLQEQTNDGTYTLLVSYASPVVLVREKYKGFRTVFVNEQTWNTSNSTRRHISRFMREFFNDDISYYDIKSAFCAMDKTRHWKAYHPNMKAIIVKCKDDIEMLERASVAMKDYNDYIDTWA